MIYANEIILIPQSSLNSAIIIASPLGKTIQAYSTYPDKILYYYRKECSSPHSYPSADFL